MEQLLTKTIKLKVGNMNERQTFTLLPVSRGTDIITLESKTRGVRARLSNGYAIIDARDVAAPNAESYIVNYTHFYIPERELNEIREFLNWMPEGNRNIL